MTIRQRLAARLDAKQDEMRRLVTAQRTDRDRLQDEIDRLKTLLQTWTDAKDADVDTLRGLGLLEGER